MNDRDDMLDDEEVMKSSGKDDVFYTPAVEFSTESDDLAFDDGEGDLCPDYTDGDD